MSAESKSTNLCKPTMEFMDIEKISWTELEIGSEKTRHKTLSDDPRTGDSTFILHFPFNYKTNSEQPVTHDFWEEVFILDGEVTDLTLNQTFGVNHYACRPPGMKHGPYTSNNPKGCTMFVINRYE